MGIITINEAKCNKCGICEQSCPITLIEQDAVTKLPFIDSAKESRCIYCGHCESVCPEGALTHQLSEKALAPLAEGNVAINPFDLGSYFRNRRSIRKYLPKQVDKAVLEQVMDVVRYAPTGTNRQLNQWVVVSDTKVIQQLAVGTIDWMKVVIRANPEMAGRYNFPVIINAYEQGIDGICRNAPHVFVCYALANHPAGAKDAVIATSHLDLLLPSYGIGSCWAGFLMLALQNMPKLKKVLGLDNSSTIHAALMAGYPKYKYYKTPYRNKADVKWM